MATTSIIGTFLDTQQATFNNLIKQLDQNIPCEITLILGNEACDMDSMVCSLVWAYYNQSQTSDSSKIFIPVFTIPKSELKLRKDAIYLFNQIDPSLLNKFFFIDTIPLNKILTNTHNNMDIDQKDNNLNQYLTLNVHLVDHNLLSISLQPILGKYVNYIIDHHKDEGCYKDKCTVNNQKRNITIVASNISYIVSHILLINNNYSDNLSSIEFKEFGILINATILLDTMCFDKNVNKTTDMDVNIYKIFEKYNLNNNSADWYQQLLKLRINNDGFTFKQLLVKDLKIFQQNHIIFGVSGISGLSLEDIITIENDNIFEIIEQFKKDKQLDITFVTNIFNDKLNNNRIQRQMTLFCDNQILFNHITSGLQLQQNKLFLGLDPINMDKYQHCNNFVTKSTKPIYYVWWKLDVKISRKKLVPLCKEILKTMKFKL